MPTKDDGKFQRPSGKQSKTRDSYTWQGYVDIPLGADEKAAFGIWLGEADDILAFVEAAVTDGYKVSLAYDSKNSAYLASLTCQNPDDPNCGFTVAGRAGSSSKALAVVLFKHFEIAQQGPWSNVTSVKKSDDIS